MEDSSVFEFDIKISSAVALDSSAGVKPSSLSPDLLEKIHRYWCAANYLTIGQVYLNDKLKGLITTKSFLFCSPPRINQYV
jgi:hypothetical protein